jgi:hypothetical protein
MSKGPQTRVSGYAPPTYRPLWTRKWEQLDITTIALCSDIGPSPYGCLGSSSAGLPKRTLCSDVMMWVTSRRKTVIGPIT